MSEPFVGEIRAMSFSSVPTGWALCDGQLLSIDQNQMLFSLIGSTYGGDGNTNFALPDLRGRSPLHVGTGIVQGMAQGEEAHTLTVDELALHTHIVNGTGATADAGSPDGALWASNTGQTPYASIANTIMAPNAISPTGGGQPHDNMPPYLTVTFMIALTGLYPIRGS